MTAQNFWNAVRLAWGPSAGSYNIADVTSPLPVQLRDSAGVERGTAANPLVVSLAKASTPSRIQSAATTNATNLKATAAVVSAIVVSNNGAAPAYLKLYNKATAPTVGTDVPLMTLLIPVGNGINIAPPAGLAFGTGLSYAITAGSADTDVAAVAANQVTGFIAWA